MIPIDFKSAGALGVAAMVAGSVLATPVLAETSTGQQAVAYQAMLTNPDSLSLNVALLEAQLGAANFEGAAVTLQRILLLNPAFDEARLIRAAVFLRLGDDAAAAADLTYLEDRPLSEDDRAEADRLWRATRESATDTRLWGVVRLGAVHDANDATGSGVVDGVPFDFPWSDTTGAFGQIQLGGEMPFGGYGHALRFQADGYGRINEGSDLNAYTSLSVGPRFDLGFAFFDITATGGLQFVGSDLYATTFGGSAAITGDLADYLSASLRVAAVHSDYDLSINTIAPLGDADGWTYSVAPSVTVRLTDSFSVTASARYSDKDAADSWYSFDAFGGGLSLLYRNAAGYRLQFGGSVFTYDYDTANPNVVNSVAREDTRYGLDASVVVPFAELIKPFSAEDPAAWTAGWSLELFGGYDVIESNIDTLDSNSITVGFAIAHRFAL